MDMFARGLAPICAEAWKMIDDQAKATLGENLSARRVVDVNGPLGWDRSCVSDGGMDPYHKHGEVGFAMRKCLRMIESRVDFSLDIMELHNVERGLSNPDLVPVERAALAAAAFEDRMVYEGISEFGTHGMSNAADVPHAKLATSDPSAFLHSVDEIVDDMATKESIAGPYAFVGGNRLRHILNQVNGGRSWLEIAEKNADIKKFVCTPSFDGAMLVSLRGGDFELFIGGDFGVGYTGREGSKLSFFITESAAFRVQEQRACVVLDIA